MNDSALATMPVEDPYKVRNIEVNLTNDDILYLNKVIRKEPNRGNLSALFEAIGYLVTYVTHGNYDSARIYRDREDLIAYYWTEGGRRFTMGAIWRSDLGKFTFHS